MTELPADRAAAPLRSLASDATHPEVRIRALEGLAELSPTDALSLLEQATWSDKDPEVREDAVWALAELPGGSGIPMLVKVARIHPDHDLREEAMEALAESGDDRARRALRSMAQ